MEPDALVLAPDAAVADVGGLGARPGAGSRGNDARGRIRRPGYGRLEDRRRSVEAGFDAHVTKPAAVGDILRAIPGAPR